MIENPLTPELHRTKTNIGAQYYIHDECILDPANVEDCLGLFLKNV